MSVFNDKPRPQGLKNPFSSLPEIPPSLILAIVAIGILIGIYLAIAPMFKEQPLAARFTTNPLKLSDMNYSILTVRVVNLDTTDYMKTTLRVESPETNLVVLPLQREFAIPAGDVREYEFMAQPNPSEKSIPSGLYTINIEWDTGTKKFSAQTRLEVRN